MMQGRQKPRQDGVDVGKRGAIIVVCFVKTLRLRKLEMMMCSQAEKSHSFTSLKKTSAEDSVFSPLLTAFLQKNASFSPSSYETDASLDGGPGGRSQHLSGGGIGEASVPIVTSQRAEVRNLRVLACPFLQFGTKFQKHKKVFFSHLLWEFISLAGKHNIHNMHNI